MTVRRALLSVSDKTGIVAFAKILQKAGYEIVSTGGTLKELQKAKIRATSAEDVTEFPECFGGRVKTMHPKIMGGILFNRELKEDREQAKKLGIEPIDIVVVNLYPFEEVMEKWQNGRRAEGQNVQDPAAFLPCCLPAFLIEQIDIGGPTLLRSAAKNHAAVTVICDPADYHEVGSQIQKNGETTLEFRQQLAAKVFVKTAQYDASIAGYFGMNRGIILTNGKKLRYGENPHQWGEFYAIDSSQQFSFADFDKQVSGNRFLVSGSKPETKNQQTKNFSWRQLQGKDLSYLNILDADAAWRMVCDFSEPTSVMIKHTNPSGIASALTIEEAFQASYDTDRLSAFGVIIALNRECSDEIAKKIIDQKIFVEVILAPSIAKGAQGLLKQKPNIRLLDMDSVRLSQDIIYRSAFGGMLVQNDDTQEILEKDLTCVTKKKPTKEQIADLLFAWKVVKHAKSNAIVLVKDEVTVGIGCGQTSRVDSSWIAAKRAGARAKGAVLASDAFFPFPDALEEAAKSGISAVIQPGGSVRDSEVIACADRLGIAMVVTGVRAFRH